MNGVMLSCCHAVMLSCCHAVHSGVELCMLMYGMISIRCTSNPRALKITYYEYSNNCRRECKKKNRTGIEQESIL